MRKLQKLAAVIMAIASFGGQGAYASMIGSPMALRGVIEPIRVTEPSLLPMADIKVCMHYSGECVPAPRKINFGGSVAHRLSLGLDADAEELRLVGLGRPGPRVD